MSRAWKESEISHDRQRELTDHQCAGCDNVRVLVPKRACNPPGGVAHEYQVMVKSQDDPKAWYHNEIITFQCGGVAAAGPNGLTDAALLAIVADRLRGFQAGPGACDENRIALSSVEHALATLKARSMRVRGEREAAAQG